MFDKIIGNEKSKELLEHIIRSGNISHSYIFSGTVGIGKALFAREFAKGILCLDKNSRPCGKCKSCLEIKNLNNPDFFQINSDGSSIKIEQIRGMNKNIIEKPIVSSKKVYIINDADKMTKEAQNSLLKTLEEPPEYAHIILISSNDNLLLNTIKSRCVKINFDKLTDEEIKKISPDMSKSLQDYELLSNTFNNLENINIIELLNSKGDIFKDKDDVYGVLENINLIFLNLLRKNVGAASYAARGACEWAPTTKIRQMHRNYRKH